MLNLGANGELEASVDGCCNCMQRWQVLQLEGGASAAKCYNWMHRGDPLALAVRLKESVVCDRANSYIAQVVICLALT